ncbi:MAG TPA: hypothetical protein V6D16_21925, partial [Candidatus Obscuribacterales bacterium]
EDAIADDLPKYIGGDRKDSAEIHLLTPSAIPDNALNTISKAISDLERVFKVSEGIACKAVPCQLDLMIARLAPVEPK